MTFPLNIFVVLVDVIFWDENREVLLLVKYRPNITNSHPNDFLLALTKHKFRDRMSSTYQFSSCSENHAVGWVTLLDNDDKITSLQALENIFSNIIDNDECRNTSENYKQLLICKDEISQAISNRKNDQMDCFKN